MSTLELQVNDEVYVSVEGLEYIKEFHEDIAGYCFTSKVRILDSWVYDQDNKEGKMYLCAFVNDPLKVEIELAENEISLVPLHFFNTNPNAPVDALLTTPMEIEPQQMELKIEDGEFKVPSFISIFEEKGRKIGALVDSKQKAYGSAVERSNEVLKAFMKPHYNEETKTYNIPESLFLHMQILVRTIDKWNRIVNNPEQDKMDENTYDDITGYSLLGSVLTGR